MAKIPEVSLCICSSFFFSLLNIVYRLGGNNPALRIDIINRELNPLSAMFGEEPQVLSSDRHVRPESFMEHLKHSHALRLPQLVGILRNTRAAFFLPVRKACAAYQTNLGQQPAA